MVAGADFEAADGVAAAVVGTTEVSVVRMLGADGREGLVAERDVGSLVEGHAAAGNIGRGVIVAVDEGSQVAQVVLAGDGVGVDASLIGDREEVAAQGHAELVSRGSPVRGILILQGERQRGGIVQRKRLSFLPFPEDIGMGACTVERDDAYLSVFLIEQQPIGIDVAFPVAFVVARQQVVMVFRREGFTLLKQPYNGVKFN